MRGVSRVFARAPLRNPCSQHGAIMSNMHSAHAVQIDERKVGSETEVLRICPTSSIKA